MPLLSQAAEPRPNHSETHTLLDGEFVINTCRLWWRSSQLATIYDDVTVTKWRLIS